MVITFQSVRLSAVLRMSARSQDFESQLSFYDGPSMTQEPPPFHIIVNYVNSCSGQTDFRRTAVLHYLTTLYLKQFQYRVQFSSTALIVLYILHSFFTYNI